MVIRLDIIVIYLLYLLFLIGNIPLLILLSKNHLGVLNRRCASKLGSGVGCF